jgi:hypothetical protein
MKTVKKLWSVLLALALVVSLMAGSFSASAAEGPFEADTALTNGREYVIVTEADGKYFALSKGESGLGAEEVTVADGKIADAPDTAIWIAHFDDPTTTVESLASPGSFIFAGSGGFMTYSGGRGFDYDAEAQVVALHGGKYYMTFNGTAFDQGTKDEACKVLIFGRGEAVSTEKVKIDYPEPETIVKSAVKNADGSIVLAFTSDVHYDGKNLNLKTWLEAAEADVGFIDSMGFCGDMGSAYATSVDDFWTWTGDIMGFMDTQIAEGKVGSAVYTRGNHEWFPSAGGNYAGVYDKYDAAKRLMQVGEAVRTEDYIIYCFGSGEIAKTFSYDYAEEDIAELAEYLKTAPTDIPIFILTHFPIHYWNAVDPTSGRAEERYMKSAAALIDVLNTHDNLVVLWGHNHSNFDDFYYDPKFPGDEIVTGPEGTVKQLNFTYLAAGCTADAEYTGPEAGSAATMNKGLIVTIGADKKLSYTYYTINGETMGVEAPWLVRFRDGVNYEVYDARYVDDGSTVKLPEVKAFDGYVFTGWYYWDDCVAIPFDETTPVTNNMLVTAGYRYDTGRSTDYVYITVQLADGIAVGKSGAPILMYPVPYYKGITGIKALQALQDAECPVESKVASAGYGYLAGVWGLDTENTWLMATNSSNGYVSASSALEPGNCYYVLTYEDEADRRSTSFLKPFTAEAEAGEAVAFDAAYWYFNEANKYEVKPITGTVFYGKSLDDLKDTGVACADGEFTLSFPWGGEYYVAVKAEGIGLAVTKITVKGDAEPGEDPRVQVSPQAVTVNGEEKVVDHYNIDDTNFFKLRDLACILAGTKGAFDVAYDEAERKINVTLGGVYTPLPTDMQTGDDLSATAVKSTQALYIDGSAVMFTAFNIGGYNYVRLVDVAPYLGFTVAYDADTNTAQIITD